MRIWVQRFGCTLMPGRPGSDTGHGGAFRFLPLPACGGRGEGFWAWHLTASMQSSFTSSLESNRCRVDSWSLEHGSTAKASGSAFLDITRLPQHAACWSEKSFWYCSTRMAPPFAKHNVWAPRVVQVPSTAQGCKKRSHLKWTT